MPKVTQRVRGTLVVKHQKYGFRAHSVFSHLVTIKSCSIRRAVYKLCYHF